jgi:hypothetical protein
LNLKLEAEWKKTDTVDSDISSGMWKEEAIERRRENELDIPENGSTSTSTKMGVGEQRTTTAKTVTTATAEEGRV